MKYLWISALTLLYPVSLARADVFTSCLTVRDPIGYLAIFAQTKRMPDRSPAFLTVRLRDISGRTMVYGPAPVRDVDGAGRVYAAPLDLSNQSLSDGEQAVALTMTVDGRKEYCPLVEYQNLSRRAPNAAGAARNYGNCPHCVRQAVCQSLSEVFGTPVEQEDCPSDFPPYWDDDQDIVDALYGE